MSHLNPSGVYFIRGGAGGGETSPVNAFPRFFNYAGFPMKLPELNPI